MVGALQTPFNTFNPKQLGTATLLGWYRADSFVGSDGDAVGTWADSSGNGRDMTQGTAGKKPLYKTGILNGKPVMRFASASSQTMAAASSVISLASALTLFVVAMQTSVADATLLSTVNAVNGDLFRFRTNAGTQQLRWYSIGLYDANTGIGANNWGAYTCIVRGTSGAGGTVSFRANGTALGTSGSISRAALHEGNLHIGSNIDLGSYMNGDIAEILVCNGELTALQYTQVEAYLKQKYAL